MEINFRIRQPSSLASESGSTVVAGGTMSCRFQWA